jgi:hypothetical protein
MLLDLVGTWAAQDISELSVTVSSSAVLSSAFIKLRSHRVRDGECLSVGRV